MNLYRLDHEPVTWKVNVIFGYFSGELGSRIAQLDVHEDQIVEENRVLVTLTGDVLNDPFANTLAATLRQFVEVITPVVDKFQEESNQEEA